MAVAGPSDGWAILESLGFTKDRLITKAVIVIEVDRCVEVRTREYAQPFNVTNDSLDMLTKKYVLMERGAEPKEDPEAHIIREPGAYRVKRVGGITTIEKVECE